MSEVAARVRHRAFLRSTLPTLVLCGCYSAYDYLGPQDSAIKYGSGPEPVNPTHYRVNPKDFPRYRVDSARHPPHLAYMDHGVLRNFDRPVVAILPTDTWEVRYKYKDFLMVNSLDFDRRECIDKERRGAGRQVKADGSCHYDWCLYISERGAVTGGWDNCTLGGDKITFKPDPDAVKLQDWGPQPFFEVISRPAR